MIRECHLSIMNTLTESECGRLRLRLCLRIRVYTAAVLKRMLVSNEHTRMCDANALLSCDD